MAGKKFDIALILSAVDKASKVINQMANNATTRLSKLQAKTAAMADKSFKSGQQLVAGGIALGAPIYKAVEAASDFETKMVDIRKQLNELDDPKVMAAFTKDIYALGKQLPISIGDIQELVAAGARMGIPKKQLVDYTKEVTKMSIAFDIGAAQIGEDMGKIATVFNIPIRNIGKMADAINYLDDNAQSKGADIIDVLLRIGQASKYMSSNQAAALASTMLTLGESGETSATGINKLITVLGAASVQSAKVRKGLATLGLDPGKVQKRFTTDAQGTIIDVFQRINKLAKVKQASVLTQLFGLEQGPKLTKLVSRIDEYKRQLDLVNGKEKGSMNKEYVKRIGTTASQFQLMKNELLILTVEIGSKLLPALKKIFTQLKPTIEKVVDFIQKHPQLTANILKGVAALSLLKIGLGYLNFVFGGTFRTISTGLKFFKKGADGISHFSKVVGSAKKLFLTLRLAGVFNKFAGAVGPLARLENAFKTVFSSIGKSIMSLGRFLIANPIILIIAAIVVAAYLIYKHWDKIKAFFVKLWDGIKVVFKTAWDWLKKMFLNYTPYGLVIKHWDKIRAFFVKVWRFVGAVFKGTWQGIKTMLLNFTPHGLIITHWAKITGWFSELWEKVKVVFNGWMQWLLGIGPRMLAAGRGFIVNLWNGIKEKAQWLVDKVKGIAQKIRDLWPFSPAKSGPLRDIHKIKLMETIAATVKPIPMLNAMRNVQQNIGNNFRNGSVSPIPVRGGESFVFAPVIHLSGDARPQDAEMLKREMRKQFDEFLRDKERYNSRTKF